MDARWRDINELTNWTLTMYRKEDKIKMQKRGLSSENPNNKNSGSLIN
jgi:hypothetical protein